MTISEVVGVFRDIAINKHHVDLVSTSFLITIID